MRRSVAGAALAVLALTGCSSPAMPTSDAAGLLVIAGSSLLVPDATGRTPGERAGGLLGAFVDVDPHPGLGLTAPRFRQLPPVLQAADQGPEAYYDSVLVQGGEVDALAPPEQVEIASSQLVDRLRIFAHPGTRLVLMGPFGDPADPALSRVRDQMQAVAKAKRVHFLDPLTLGLRADDPQLGEELAGLLRELGVGRPAPRAKA